MTMSSIGERLPSNMAPLLATPRLFADLTPIPLSLTIMDPDVAPSDFAHEAEHAWFGQNCFYVSIGSKLVCISYKMPMDPCFFKLS